MKELKVEEKLQSRTIHTFFPILLVNEKEDKS